MAARNLDRLRLTPPTWLSDGQIRPDKMTLLTSQGKAWFQFR